MNQVHHPGVGSGIRRPEMLSSAEDPGETCPEDAAVRLQTVTLSYPVPKRYSEHFFHPFRPPERRTAVQDVSLELERCGRLALVGPNGAGKTTVLKLMGGLLYPTRGAVQVCGIDTAVGNAEVRQRVGMVINEERSFYWRLTGRQNLEFFATLDNLVGSARRDRIEHLLDQVGLSSAADRTVATYSAGMRQRLAIARGLLSDPEILLLDEPTKSLDPSGADAIRALISDSDTACGRTLVVTTNQLPDIPSVCDELCVMRGGAIVARHQLQRSGVAEIETLYREAMARS